jgi:hypothetical protein
MNKDELQKLIDEEGLSVSQWAQIAGGPPWKVITGLREMVKEGVAVKGTVMRETSLGMKETAVYAPLPRNK